MILLLACTGPASDDGKPDETGDTVDTSAQESGESEDTTPVDADADGHPADTDCDDGNAAVHPGADEVCNDQDDDCDQLVDDADPGLVGGTAFYADADADGWGGAEVVACEGGEGLVAAGGDCDDGDAEVSPDAEERCNGYDDDCNGLTDEDDPGLVSRLLWYADRDGDGYGDDDVREAACEAPAEYVDNGDDCDDRDDEVFPGATEVCDGRDNDCDGAADDADPHVEGELLYQDLDRDGYGTADATRSGCDDGGGWATRDDDCDDDAASVHPGAIELCNDVDDDCDGATDEAGAADEPTWYLDRDADGYGLDSSTTRACDEPAGYADAGGDCDDGDATVNPDAVDTPADGEDSNCDGANDYDGDGDGYVLDTWADEAGLPGGDCDDDARATHPGADELCDGADNDCDDEIDEGTPVDAPAWYLDADADGYGASDTSVIACDAPEGYVDNDDDCDDADPAMLDVGCGGGHGGHRIDKDGRYYYALYDDTGFGVLGTSEWYGTSDRASAPEGVTWSPDLTVLYYNDLSGNVFAQSEPFGSSSTLVGTFGLGQVGGGVVTDTHYYVGDYSGGNIYTMDLSTGRTSLYASLGGACKPYFGNSAMAIDDDGSVYAASSCGIVRYEAGGTAVDLAAYSNLISAVAMDAEQELYGMDYSGRIVHFDKTDGSVLSSITMAVPPSTTWTLAVDEDGNFVTNYWGEQRVFSSVDGSVVTEWSASSWYPGSSGYYWYVTF